MHIRRLTTDAMFLCAALMLAFLESLLPPLPVPGVKLGLANLAILCCVYGVGLADGAAVAVIRWLVMGLLFGSGTSILFSLAGTVSVLGMLCLLHLAGQIHIKRNDGEQVSDVRIHGGRLSFVGISVLTALAHNLGQLFCASLLYGWGREILLVYGSGLVLCGTTCGTLTGWICNLLFRRFGELSRGL